MVILYFSDILKKVGLDPKKVKLIRHALSDKVFKECADNGKVYEYWVVFISGKGTLAQLYAIYKVGDYVSDTPDMLPEGMPEKEAECYKRR